MKRIISFFLLILPVCVLAQETPLKVMTFNIRYDNQGDGVNQWSNRKEKVADLIRKYDPDIIGVQEALHNQMEDLGGALKGYQPVGVGREDGQQKGEYSALFIRKKRFRIESSGTFWLSKTPDVPGSKHWDASLSRVATWAKLRDKKTRKPFLAMNTHFDHRGAESRKQAAQMLKDSAASMGDGGPVVITGDFNFTREAEPYAVMISGDPIVLLDPAPENPPGTFCDFKVGGRDCAGIDYIFVSPHWQVQRYQVIDDNDGTWYPSDHLPVMVSITLQ
jgi:endonuclease/exonuclease/phosphatase family metal-dependent hydrolase